MLGLTTDEPLSFLSPFSASKSSSSSLQLGSLSAGSPTFTKQLMFLGVNAALGGFLFGYDTSSMSSALIQLKQPRRDGRPCPGLLESGLNTLECEMVTSFVVLGAFLGAVGAGPANLRLGRKKVLLLASSCIVLGSVLQYSSYTLAQMLIGRLVLGCGVGICSHTVPLYISEVSPPAYRGSLCFLNDMMIPVGQMAAALLSTVFFHSEMANGWRLILLLGAVPALLMFLGILLQPESPRWLLSKDRYEEAMAAQVLLAGEAADHATVQAEFDEMVKSIKEEQDNSCSESGIRYVYHTYIKNGRVRRALILGCGLQFLQQWSGINTIMYYGATVLQDASTPTNDDLGTCFTTANKSNVAYTTLFALGQVPTVFLAWYFVDVYGRRPLILLSLAVSTVSLVLCGCIFSPDDVSEGSVVGFVMLYLASFGLGLGPVPWTVNAEIYPLSVRAQCVSCSCATNWLNNFAISSTFLSTAAALSTHQDDPGSHPDGVFWFYAYFAGLGLVALYMKMPETNGLTLEEIGDLFEDPDEGKEEKPVSPL